MLSYDIMRTKIKVLDQDLKLRTRLKHEKTHGHTDTELLDCIECLRCRLLLPMCAVSVRQSVCLSRGSTRLHCAKTAKRIKILFEVDTLGAQGILC